MGARDVEVNVTKIDVPDDTTVETGAADDTQLVEQDLLVEDVSIDGMCGVY